MMKIKKIENECKHIINLINELEELKVKENQIQDQIKEKLNEIEDFSMFEYEELKMIKKKYSYCFSEEKENQLFSAVEKKRIEKYPLLLHPTYYPEIDTLNKSAEEKLRLDQTARKNFRNFMGEDKLSKFKLSKADAEDLVNLGIAEKNYCGYCENCNTTFILCSEVELEKHKRVWELEEKINLTSEELEEYDRLEQDGYGGIYNFCTFCEEETEIHTKEQFEKQPKTVMYRIVKKPDLQYESI